MFTVFDRLKWRNYSQSRLVLTVAVSSQSRLNGNDIENQAPINHIDDYMRDYMMDNA